MKTLVTSPIERRRRDERIARLAAVPRPTDAQIDELRRLRIARDHWCRSLPRRVRDARFRLSCLLRDAERFGVDLDPEIAR